MTLKEYMTLKEIFPTTIFSVKLMHDCITYNQLSNPSSETNFFVKGEMISQKV